MIPPECYPEKAPQINTLLDTLAHHTRREVIHHFENGTETDTLALDELADVLHDRIPDTSHESLKIELAHNHLPKFVQRGWVDYDPRTREIRYYGNEDAPLLLDEVRAVF